MDSDEVRGHAPELPPELVERMKPTYGQVPMRDTGKPAVLFYDRSPADVIPVLT